MKQLVIIAFTMMLGACSSINPLNKNINKGVDVDTVKLRGGSEVPEWFFDYPKDDEWVYGVATGHSEDMQFAIDKGIHDAKVMVADKLQNYINGDFKRYIEDSGSQEIKLTSFHFNLNCLKNALRLTEAPSIKNRCS